MWGDALPIYTTLTTLPSPDEQLCRWGVPKRRLTVYIVTAIGLYTCSSISRYFYFASIHMYFDEPSIPPTLGSVSRGNGNCRTIALNYFFYFPVPFIPHPFTNTFMFLLSRPSLPLHRTGYKSGWWDNSADHKPLS